MSIVRPCFTSIMHTSSYLLNPIPPQSFYTINPNLMEAHDVGTHTHTHIHSSTMICMFNMKTEEIRWICAVLWRVAVKTRLFVLSLWMGRCVLRNDCQHWKVVRKSNLLRDHNYRVVLSNTQQQPQNGMIVVLDFDCGMFRLYMLNEDRMLDWSLLQVSICRS